MIAWPWLSWAPCPQFAGQGDQRNCDVDAVYDDEQGDGDDCDNEDDLDGDIDNGGDADAINDGHGRRMGLDE